MIEYENFVNQVALRLRPVKLEYEYEVGAEVCQAPIKFGQLNQLPVSLLAKYTSHIPSLLCKLFLSLLPTLLLCLLVSSNIPIVAKFQDPLLSRLGGQLGGWVGKNLK